MDVLLLVFAIAFFLLFWAAAIALVFWAAITWIMRARVRPRRHDVEALVPGDATVIGVVPAIARTSTSTWKMVGGLVGAFLVVQAIVSLDDGRFLTAGLVATLVLAVGLVALAPGANGRLLAFTADGWVWSMSRDLGYAPREVLGRVPIEGWNPKRVLTFQLEATVADERLAFPRFGWRDQLPKPHTIATPTP